MPLNAKKVSSNKKGGERAAPLSPGTYEARLASIVDLGYQPVTKFQSTELEPKYQLMVSFVIVNHNEEEGRFIGKKLNQYGDMTNQKALEVIYLTALNGGKIEETDWSKLIGRKVMLQVVNRERKDGSIMHQIGQVIPSAGSDDGGPDELPDSAKTDKQVLVFSPQTSSKEDFEKLADWLKELVRNAIDFGDSPLAAELGSNSTQPGGESNEDIPY